MAVPIVMIICGLVFVALPVFYFGAIDGTTIMVLAAGLGLLAWAGFRIYQLNTTPPER